MGLGAVATSLSAQAFGRITHEVAVPTANYLDDSEFGELRKLLARLHPPAGKLRLAADLRLQAEPAVHEAADSLGPNWI
jgi:hypothetical protein